MRYKHLDSKYFVPFNIKMLYLDVLVEPGGLQLAAVCSFLGLCVQLLQLLYALLQPAGLLLQPRPLPASLLRQRLRRPTRFLHIG